MQKKRKEGIYNLASRQGAEVTNTPEEVIRLEHGQDLFFEDSHDGHTSCQTMQLPMQRLMASSISSSQYTGRTATAMPTALLRRKTSEQISMHASQATHLTASTTGAFMLGIHCEAIIFH
jgi:hypothetical protein